MESFKLLSKNHEFTWKLTGKLLIWQWEQPAPWSKLIIIHRILGSKKVLNSQMELFRDAKLERFSLSVQRIGHCNQGIQTASCNATKARSRERKTKRSNRRLFTLSVWSMIFNLRSQILCQVSHGNRINVNGVLSSTSSSSFSCASNCSSSSTLSQSFSSLPDLTCICPSSSAWNFASLFQL